LNEQSKLDQVAKASNRLGNNLINISSEYTKDMNELTNQLTLKPYIIDILDDINNKISNNVIGRDINSLSRDIQTKETHLNKDIVEQRFLDLNKEYINLVD
jgi:hypothetical protein